MDCAAGCSLVEAEEVVAGLDGFADEVAHQVDDASLEFEEVGVVVDDEPTEVRQLVGLELLDRVSGDGLADLVEHLLVEDRVETHRLEVGIGAEHRERLLELLELVRATLRQIRTCLHVRGEPDRVVPREPDSLGNPTAPTVELAADGSCSP